MENVYIIDGINFSTLEEFYEEISLRIIPGMKWGKNLDAFNDILRGGFGTPKEGFTIIWLNSNISRERLGNYNFTQIIEIINDHSISGSEPESNIVLQLK